MLQRSNWQHLLSLRAALIRFLTHLRNLVDAYLSLNHDVWRHVIYLTLELLLNKKQASVCGLNGFLFGDIHLQSS